NLPGVLFAGQQVKSPYSVINSGNGNIKQSQAWNDVISISSSPVGGAGSKTMGSVNRRGELLTGGIYNDSIVANIPPNISGNYYIVIKTDENNRIYEENETNNTKSVLVHILMPQPADLIVSNITLPTNTQLGDTIIASYTIKNDGANVAVGKLSDAIYLSKDTTF